ncbi:MAG: tetratricopeptide repeat protein, partial [Planctomycetes bacterium]|nr:tetratricopeptide repeat protein [Planctomycetota bacterium]
MATSFDDKKKIAADCWRKGSEAMARENWDYAIDMFSKAVAFVPENLMYRQTLRGGEYRKYNNNKTGAKMAGMKLMGIRGRIKKAKMQKDWEAVERAAEDGLKINPWDAQLNADLGEAAKNLGYGEVAVFAYQCALKEDPDNKAYNRAYAEILENRGEYQQALKIWGHLMKLDPHDSEARMKYNELQASAVLDRGGYEKAESAKDTLAEQKLAKQIGLDKSGEAIGPGMSVEADLQRAIRKEPDNPDPYVKLAQHYRSERKLEEALELLRKAAEVSGGESGIVEQAEDVELELMRKNVEEAKQA